MSGTSGAVLGYTIRRIDYHDGTSCRGGHPPNCPLVGYVAPHGGPARAALHVVRHGLSLRVSFSAPVAIPDARSYYSLNVQFEHGSCYGAGVLAQSDRDYARGAEVHMTATLRGGCHGRVSGTVALVRSAGASGGMPVPPNARGAVVVGRFERDLP